MIIHVQGIVLADNFEVTLHAYKYSVLDCPKLYGLQLPFENTGQYRISQLNFFTLVYLAHGHCVTWCYYQAGMITDHQ